MKIAFLRKRIKYINELNEKNNYEEELLIDDTIFSNSPDIYKLDELQQYNYLKYKRYITFSANNCRGCCSCRGARGEQSYLRREYA